MGFSSPLKFCVIAYFSDTKILQKIDVLKIFRAQSATGTGGNYSVLMKTGDL